WQTLVRLLMYTLGTAALLGLPPLILFAAAVGLLPRPWDCLDSFPGALIRQGDRLTTSSSFPEGLICMGWDRVKPWETQWTLHILHEDSYDDSSPVIWGFNPWRVNPVHDYRVEHQSGFENVVT